MRVNVLFFCYIDDLYLAHKYLMTRAEFSEVMLFFFFFFENFQLEVTRLED